MISFGTGTEAHTYQRAKRKALRALVSLTVCVVAAELIGCNQKETGGRGGTPSERPAATRMIDPAAVGAVTGKISFQGEPPKLAVIQMDQDPTCAAKQGQPVHAEDGAVNADHTLPNAFIYVKSGAEDYAFPVPNEAVTLDQNGCVYRPHVLGLMAGQTLLIVSSDATTHNVHAMARENRPWNESQLPGAAPIRKVFSRSEVMIPVKCNEHPWMRAYVGVVNNPFFAVTGAGGTYTLKGLPPGEYRIEAWTALYGAREARVTVTPRSTATLDFAFRARGTP